MFDSLKIYKFGKNDYNYRSPNGFEFELCNIPHDLLNKIMFEQFLNVRFVFTTFEYPINAAAFEHDVMTFLTKFSDRIAEVHIGHVNWVNAVNFSLSLDFCKRLATIRKLWKLRLCKVSDQPQVEELFKRIYGEEQI